MLIIHSIVSTNIRLLTRGCTGTKPDSVLHFPESNCFFLRAAYLYPTPQFPTQVCLFTRQHGGTEESMRQMDQHVWMYVRTQKVFKKTQTNKSFLKCHCWLMFNISGAWSNIWIIQFSEVRKKDLKEEHTPHLRVANIITASFVWRYMVSNLQWNRQLRTWQIHTGLQSQTSSAITANHSRSPCQQSSDWFNKQGRRHQQSCPTRWY